MSRRHAQTGYIALATAAILLLATSIYIGRGLVRHSPSGESERARTLALRDARYALLARAALEDSTPGTLPCPDIDGDGDSDNANCSIAQPEALGCLPWRTLGLPPGEQYGLARLWYALSPTFKNSHSAQNRNTAAEQINLDNFGSLTLRSLAGNTPAIAVIIAPGAPNTGQNRSGLDCNAATAPAFLESPGLTALPFSNATGDGNIVLAAANANFNDRLEVIDHDALFRPVLSVILNAFASPDEPTLQRYYASTGSLPPQALNLSPSGYKAPATIDRTTAGPVLFDHNFNGSASLQAGAAGTNCNSVVDGSGPSTKYPASWLCYNRWYDYIQYSPSASPSSATVAQLELRLGTYASASSFSGYRCTLNVLSAGKTDPVQCQ